MLALKTIEVMKNHIAASEDAVRRGIRETRWQGRMETVLPGVTRDSMIHILRDWGYKVNETRLSIDDLMKAGHDGKLEEVFGTGTAAVISPVGELRYKDDVITINDFKIGELTQKLYDTLTGIQWGKLEDKYGWTVEVK